MILEKLKTLFYNKSPKPALKFLQMDLLTSSLKLSTHKFHLLFEHSLNHVYLYQATQTKNIEIPSSMKNSKSMMLYIFEGIGTIVYNQHLLEFEEGQIITLGSIKEISQIKPLSNRIVMLFILENP